MEVSHDSQRNDYNVNISKPGLQSSQLLHDTKVRTKCSSLLLSCLGGEQVRGGMESAPSLKS